MLNNDYTLHLGKVDDSDKTWINGTLIGEMESSWNVSRIYKVPNCALKEGQNVLTVRVEDYRNYGGIHGDAGIILAADNHQLHLEGDWKYRISPVNFRVDVAGIEPNDIPTLLFNAMLHPMLNYNIKGIIWYQGESNVGRHQQYRELFPLMISDWREQWGNNDMPFLFVQLANFQQPVDTPQVSNWALLREAQTMALQLKNTGMAVAIDIGEADDIHPRNKQDVGHRLALAAFKIAYNMDVEHSGPVFKSMEVDNEKITISFDNIGSGLKINDKYDYLKGFTIAGEDKNFVWAKAYVAGNKVVVYNPSVKQPKAVRYAWANNPNMANLYNNENLPACPFRTDDW